MGTFKPKENRGRGKVWDTQKKKVLFSDSARDDGEGKGIKLRTEMYSRSLKVGGGDQNGNLFTQREKGTGCTAIGAKSREY